ncbi:MAG: hypothetical protein RCG15_00965 [Candidatus Rickettsia vulgarisii]
MFTGIVEEVGEVLEIHDKEYDRDLFIKATNNNLAIGDSISVNGVCLTVREKSIDKFLVSVGNETLKLTNLGRLK